jgi:pimeloyl-ACP methyl ester carboxylesterase
MSLTTSSAAALLAGDGVTLSYLPPRPADGPPLVLLHGLSGASYSWSPVINRFGDSWRTWALDFRGHGRSGHATGRYGLADYMADAERLLEAIGEPVVVAGHSLGGVVAAALAQAQHPLVSAVFLEDPPLFLVERAAFAASHFSPSFRALAEHVARLQADEAPITTYGRLLAAVPHAGGGTLGDNLFPDALWARAEALAQMDVGAIAAALDGRTFAGYEPDRPILCPGLLVRADPTYDAGFLPEHEARLHSVSPQVDVVEIPGAGHNLRGDRCGRAAYLDVLGGFLARVA